MVEKEKESIFKDKNILVVGLARSGIGACHLLDTLGARVSVTDLKPCESLKSEIRKLPPSVKVIAGKHPDEVFNTADMIVISPGVPLNTPQIINAKRLGITVIGELELAYQVIRQSTKHRTQKTDFIAITGTNGKSTTVTLIDLMLKRAGLESMLAGNIGNALTEEISNLKSQVSNFEFIVTEVSSFQLESIKDFKPLISVILNITPDHLDRYKDIREYMNAKGNIFINQGAGDYLLLNADDPLVMELYYSERIRHRSDDINILFFSMNKEVEGIYKKDSGLFLNLLSTPGTAPSGFVRKGFVPPFKLISIDEIRIKGVHNIENAMAASLVAFLCGCPVDSIIDILRTFPGLAHRLELVRNIKGVQYINDSKGTNVGAVKKSIESFENVVLIMGGRDKNSDFSVLKDLVRQKVKALILIGEAKEKIAHQLGDITDTVFASTMDEAVKVASEKATVGDTVLLSPGCASFDMFNDFEDRGERFREAVLNL
jgi:UDP-N-acetylmuramoylalanine--D-glutamate ligase